MSAVITAPFGDKSAVHAAEVGNATFSRALRMGYSRTMARELSIRAKAVAGPWESAASVARRLVPERTVSGPYRPGPGSAA